MNFSYKTNVFYLKIQSNTFTWISNLDTCRENLGLKHVSQINHFVFVYEKYTNLGTCRIWHEYNLWWPKIIIQ